MRRNLSVVVLISQLEKSQPPQLFSPVHTALRTSEVGINVGSTDFERRLHFRSCRLPCGAYGPWFGLPDVASSIAVCVSSRP